jgi:voltage-gated potassium channel Kch
MRLGRLAISSFLVFLLFTLINLLLAVPMGLGPSQNFNGSFVDAFYFSTVVTTTLGFGDISPSTPLGRIIVSIEALAGFVIFALLTSTMYRKFTS